MLEFSRGVSARVAGAREALFAAGLEPPRDFYRIGDPRDAAFVQELTAGRKIDGIICANDFTAAQLMHSLAKAKIRVPDVLSSPRIYLQRLEQALVGARLSQEGHIAVRWKNSAGERAEP